MEQKNIVIRLPRLSWALLLNKKTLFSTLFLCLTFLGVYWNRNIRPYLWVHQGQVHLYSLSIPADRAGKMEHLAFTEGDFVQKGQKLFSLDAEEISLQRKQIQGQIQHLQEQARLEKGRMDQIMQEYLVASSELDMGLGSAEKIQDQLQQLEASQTKNESYLYEVSRYQKELESVQAALDQLGTHAPFSGRIFKQMKKEGERVQVGEPVLVFSDPRRIWVEVLVPEQSIEAIQVGGLARIQIVAYPKKEWQGKVSWIGPQAVEKTSSTGKALIPVRVAFDQLEEPLIDGLSAKVAFRIR